MEILEALAGLENFKDASLHHLTTCGSPTASQIK